MYNGPRLLEQLEARTLLSGSAHLIDVNLGTADGAAHDFTPLNGSVYFASILHSGNGGANGGFFRTDGTDTGTTLLRQLSIWHIVQAGGKLFMIANDGHNGAELWTSDGTAAGTSKLTDMSPDKVWDENLIAAGADRVYFRRGNDLYASDGTPQGTRRVATAAGSIERLSVIGNTAFFIDWMSQTSHQLWRSDGTEEGTTVVADYVSSVPIEYRGQAYFVSDENKLMRSDITQGTAQTVADVGPDQGADFPRRAVTIFKDKLVFIAVGQDNRNKLWLSDGTADGTVAIADAPSTTDYIFATNDWLFFSAQGWSTSALWKTDGTPGGAVKVMDLQTSITYFRSTAVAMDDVLYFSVRNDTLKQVELWRTDGSANGTEFVLPLGTPYPVMAPIAHRLYFTAFRVETGLEPWISDGTAQGSHLIRDVNLDTASSYPRIRNIVNGRIIFSAEDSLRHSRLYTYDQQTGTVVLLGDISVGDSSQDSRYGGVIGKWLYFSGYENGRNKIFKTDGTPQGTVVVSLDPYSMYGAAVFKGKLYFSDFSKLYSLDPGDDSIQEIAPIFGDAQLHVIGDRLLITAYKQNPGGGGYIPLLYVSDGTAAGTVQVWTFGAPGSFNDLGSVDQTWLFSLSTPFGAQSLWRSDGTADGTYMLHSLSGKFVTLGSAAYFMADDGLWKTDGTPAGTVKVSDVAGDQLTASGDRLYFISWDASSGLTNLWVSDGTSAGTRIVKSFSNGAAVQALAGAGGWLFFSMDDGLHGNELWRSDGTGSGTVLVQDINPGQEGSFPAAMVQDGDRIYFRAGRDDVGEELWWIPTPIALLSPPRIRLPLPASSTPITAVLRITGAAPGDRIFASKLIDDIWGNAA